MSLLRREFDSHPGMYAAQVRVNMRRARLAHAADSEPHLDSARDFLAELVPFGNARSLTYGAFGFATIFDQMRLGDWEAAEDTAARGLVACEQAALDQSNWELAWLMAMIPGPPWSRVQRRPDGMRNQEFARLASPAWVAAAIAHHRDVAALRERKKRKHVPPPPQEGDEHREDE